ncbi:hypothetical protein HAX54_004382, partial [Datura stramonium]|nr:hypothetical protein [Datura stramonium]
MRIRPISSKNRFKRYFSDGDSPVERQRRRGDRGAAGCFGRKRGGDGGFLLVVVKETVATPFPARRIKMEKKGEKRCWPWLLARGDERGGGAAMENGVREWRSGRSPY